MSDEDQLLRSMQVATATVVNLLVRRQYDVLESMTEGRFLSAAVLEQTVRSSHQSLVELPAPAYTDLRPVQEPGASPPAFRISLPLWAEGRAVSDLTLELRLIETYPGVVDVEILSLSQRPDDVTLTHDELGVVGRVVRALVEHDSSYLRQIGAYARERDPYEWTRDYGPWDQVNLVMPSGDPQTWIRFVSRSADPPVAYVGVEMSTEQEGRSDLTLELEIERQPDGTVDVRFRELHVM